MIRKQIYIDEELEQGLKILAARTGEAEAVHVRTALRAYLQDQAPVPRGNDPLLGLVGLVDDPSLPDDVAEEHDYYLYGSSKRHS